MILFLFKNENNDLNLRYNTTRVNLSIRATRLNCLSQILYRVIQKRLPAKSFNIRFFFFFFLIIVKTLILYE